MCVCVRVGGYPATSTQGSFTLGGSSYGLDKGMPNYLGRCYARLIQTKLESVRLASHVRQG